MFSHMDYSILNRKKETSVLEITYDRDVYYTQLIPELPEHNEKYKLHRLLSTLLSMELTVDEKLGIIKTEYHIPVDDKLREIQKRSLCCEGTIYTIYFQWLIKTGEDLSSVPPGLLSVFQGKICKSRDKVNDILRGGNESE